MNLRNSLLSILGLAFVGCGTPVANQPEPPAVKKNVSEDCPISSTKNSGFCAAVVETGTPKVGKDYSFTVKFWPKGRNRAELTDPAFPLTVYLKMPDCGCKSDDMEITRVGAGEYRIDKALFTKKGRWDLYLQAKNKDAVEDEFIYSFNL